MTSDVDEIKANIKKIERAWKADMKKEHGGGLDSKQNEKWMKLKVALEVLENAE